MGRATRWASITAAWALTACGPQVQIDGDGDGTGTASTSTSSPADDTADDPPIVEDLPPADLPAEECEDCPWPLDILVVVDNSSGMAPHQAKLARVMNRLVRFEPPTTGGGCGTGHPLSVQVMVTTTDMGNPQCALDQPPGHAPAMGAPVATPCTDRLADFTGLDGTSVPEVCTDACPVGLAPDDPFVAFTTDGEDNVPDVPPADIDGDGVPESPAAQALACLVPQGIDGCEYESPLEAIRQALDPDAPWNGGARPFLRPDGPVVVILVTDELDCSMGDFAAMQDPAWFNVDPATGAPARSSAICFNAGVTCDEVGDDGLLGSCTAADGPLYPVSRYTTFFADLQAHGKEVILAAALGVPEVTAHDHYPPFQPTAGGVYGLVYREWADGALPDGDILPPQWAAGVTAADKTFEYGLGPGCHGTDVIGEYTDQAIAPVRIKEVCQALDYVGPDGDARVRCTLESVCDQGFDDLIDTVHGIVAPGGTTLVPCG